jgi:hypothetical protein
MHRYTGTWLWFGILKDRSGILREIFLDTGEWACLQVFTVAVENILVHFLTG